jgi:hypothetical protein
MKVRFQVSNHVYCSERETFYKLGDIANLSDHQAKTFIDYRLVEPFEYSITDEEMIELHEKFTNTLEFEKKVDLLMIVIAKSNKNVKLSGGAELLFELTPTKPEEWFYYNKSLSEFYIENFYRCSLESFKENLERKLKNFPNYKILRKKEFERIDEILNTDNNEGILYWYKAGLDGEIPIDEKNIKALFSKKIYHGVENYLQGKALFEYALFLSNPREEFQSNNAKIGKAKLFSEYLTHDKNEKLAEKLRNEFNTEKGKSIRLMIEALKQSQLLVIPDRMNALFYQAMVDYFTRYVGSYQSVFNYKLNSHSDKEDIEKAKTKIDSILKKMKA